MGKGGPKGNQYWKLRKKHGRNKKFSSPEEMWEAAVEYFEWCDDHPWYKMESIKNGTQAGDLVKIPTQTPYSISGFMIHVGAGKAYWSQFKAANHEEYKEVIDLIETVIETQQFEGAVVGAFNANIISRKLGLIDKTEGAYPARVLPEETRVIFENYREE